MYICVGLREVFGLGDIFGVLCKLQMEHPVCQSRKHTKQSVSQKIFWNKKYLIATLELHNNEDKKLHKSRQNLICQNKTYLNGIFGLHGQISFLIKITHGHGWSGWDMFQQFYTICKLVEPCLLLEENRSRERMLFTTHQIFVIFKAQPNAMLSVWTWLANVLKGHFCRECKRDIFEGQWQQALLSSICTGLAWGWKAQEAPFSLHCFAKRRRREKQLIIYFFLTDTHTPKTYFFKLSLKAFLLVFTGLQNLPNQISVPSLPRRADHCSLRVTWWGKVDKGHWETDKADCNYMYDSTAALLSTAAFTNRISKTKTKPGEAKWTKGGLRNWQSWLCTRVRYNQPV